MNKKIFLIGLLFVTIFCVSPNVSAQTMTEAERQALIVQIQQQIVLLQIQLNQMLVEEGGNAQWCHTFNNGLGYSNSGSSEVIDLHTALQKESLSYSPDGANVYSTGTYYAVVNFQKKYGIAQTGYVGPQTRTKLNTIYGCTPVVTNCKPSWQSGAWSTCTNSQQTRTVTDVNNCGTTTSKPSTTQSCTVKPVDIKINGSDGPVSAFLTLGNGATVNGSNITLTESINLQWTGTNVASCQASDSSSVTIFSGNKSSSGSETVILSGNISSTASTSSKVTNTFKISCISAETGRSVTDSITVNLYYTVSGSCTPNWECLAWDTCSGSTQRRICTDNNGCQSLIGKPSTTQSCTVCKPSWQSGAWSTCTNSQQTRTVTDVNNCGTTTSKPSTTQSCTVKPIDVKISGSDGPINNFLTLGNGETVNGSNIVLSNNINLQWTGTNVASCQASDSLNPTIFSGYLPSSGSQIVTLSGNIQSTSSKVSNTFKITCVSTSTGSTVTDSVTANLFYTVTASCTPNWQIGAWSTCVSSQQTRTVSDLNGCGSLINKPATTQSCVMPPTVNIKANSSEGPITVTSGQSVSLSWTSTGATSCTASGGWSGTTAADGSESINTSMVGTATYTITCTNTGGTATDNVVVTTVPAVQ